MNNAKRRRAVVPARSFVCRCVDCLCSRAIAKPTRCSPCERGRHSEANAMRSTRRYLSMRQRVRAAQKAA